jgi:phosphoribosylformylglycinamidine synthase
VPTPLESVPVPSDLGAELLDLIGSPNVGSRAWIWRQYDQIVRGGTVVRPGSDAAVVRVPCGDAGDKFLAFAVDCNARLCELDAYGGGASAIAEVCRNLVTTGAEPIGITDCLNFGNPERPEVMASFAHAVDGIAAACKALDVPIVSGNVSLYNETTVQRGGTTVSMAILPTPTVAAVGMLRSADDVVTTPFKRGGDVIVLLGAAVSSGVRALGASEWLVRKLGKLSGEAPAIDLDAEVKLQKLVLDLARSQRLASAHDVSDGGLAVTLAESCAADGTVIGARVDLPVQGSPIDALAALFGEAPSRIVISVRPDAVADVLDRAAKVGVPAVRLGTTGGGTLSIAAAPLGSLSVAVPELRARAAACLAPIVGD